MDVTADQFGVVLTPVIVSRLPMDIRMKFKNESRNIMRRIYPLQ